MSKDGQEASLADVKAAARELVQTAAESSVVAPDLFPYGVNRVAVTVKSGSIEVSLEISGPDHSHESEEDMWLEAEPNDLFDESED